jgi:uncharacterized damage-inducible protein DinB
MMKMMNQDFAKVTVLSVNIAHDYEHYGNMATYMRLKGIVPPTSEKRRKFATVLPDQSCLLLRRL